MAIICPTVTATDQTTFEMQITEVATFAQRLHIDIADGEFAPTKLVPPQNVHWPKEMTADIHVMYQHPLTILETLIGLQPQLIIVHAESDDAAEVIKQLEGTGIKRGLAVLQSTPIETIRPLIEQIEHVLIFSGDLGHFGGQADTTLLTKVSAVKEWRGEIEIGWDGGVSKESIHALVVGGVDVLNVGGAVHRADDPKVAFEELQLAIGAQGATA